MRLTGSVVTVDPDADVVVRLVVLYRVKDAEESVQDLVSEDVFLARVEDIAANAILDACTGSNPRQPSQEEMVKLLKCCYYDTEVDF